MDNKLYDGSLKLSEEDLASLKNALDFISANFYYYQDGKVWKAPEVTDNALSMIRELYRTYCVY